MTVEISIMKGVRMLSKTNKVCEKYMVNKTNKACETGMANKTNGVFGRDIVNKLDRECEMDKECEMCCALEVCLECNRWMLDTGGCKERWRHADRIERFVASEDCDDSGAKYYQLSDTYEEDLCEWMLEEEVEAGRDEYRDAWWTYIGEYDD